MMDILHKLQDFSGYIAGIFTAIGTIGTFAVKYWNKLKKARLEKEKQQKEMSDRINVIFKELTPNHGSSLTDKVNKIKDELQENTKFTKENGEALKILQARQQWVLDMQNTPIFESDKNGLCTWVNDAYANLVCNDKEQLFGNGWKNFIHQDDREQIIEEWERAVKEQRNSQSSYRMVSKCGTHIYNVECYATKHKDNGYTGKLKVK